MNKKQTNGWSGILGGLVLIAVLFAGIKLIFLGLERVIPKQGADVSWSSSGAGEAADRNGPRYCVHCGGELPESFQWGQFCPWCGEQNEE